MTRDGKKGRRTSGGCVGLDRFKGDLIDSVLRAEQGQGLEQEGKTLEKSVFKFKSESLGLVSWEMGGLDSHQKVLDPDQTTTGTVATMKSTI